MFISQSHVVLYRSICTNVLVLYNYTKRYRSLLYHGRMWYYICTKLLCFTLELLDVIQHF